MTKQLGKAAAPDRPDSGRAQRKAGQATREAILSAAERLFGQYGVDAVSLNEIVQKAGVNSAALHYHFQNREGLITGIMEFRHGAWGPLRYRMLADLDAKPEITAREMVTAMVEPIAALTRFPWGADYINFLAAVATHPRYAALLHSVGDKDRPLYLKQFERVTPHLPAHIRIARFIHVSDFAYHVLASGRRRAELWLESIGESIPPWDTEDLIDMITGAITAPVHAAPTAEPRRAKS